MKSEIGLITKHIDKAAVARWEDQLEADDERAVMNLQTVLRYGAVLNSGTIVDYVKDAYAVRVNNEAPAEQPNWSAAQRHVEKMVNGEHDLTCLRCDQPVYSTYTDKLCREHFMERVGPDWAAEVRDHTKQSETGGCE